MTRRRVLIVASVFFASSLAATVGAQSGERLSDKDVAKLSRRSIMDAIDSKTSWTES